MSKVQLAKGKHSGSDDRILLQGPAVAVRFADGLGNLLVSAGADGSLVLIDRRLDGVAACARTGCSLSAMDVHQDGQSLAVGTTGADKELCPLFNCQKLTTFLFCEVGLSTGPSFPLSEAVWRNSSGF